VSSYGNRIARLAILALAAGALVGTGTATAAKKATRTAPGGVVPPAIENPAGPNVLVPFAQTFSFKGKKFKGRRVKDVEVTVNAFGNRSGSNSDLSAVLVDPRGDADQIVDPKGGSVGLPIPEIGNQMIDLTFRDGSILIPCSPFGTPRFNCNYLQGASTDDDVGTFTGELNASINPQFEDKGARGTWSLIWRDADTDSVTTTLGRAKLTLRTAKGRKK
jgi:hypothetical protein